MTQEFYEVEEILDHRNDDNEIAYFIKWKGYPRTQDNTWEPVSNLGRAPTAINDYWQRKKQLLYSTLKYPTPSPSPSIKIRIPLKRRRSETSIQEASPEPGSTTEEEGDSELDEEYELPPPSSPLQEQQDFFDLEDDSFISSAPMNDVQNDLLPVQDSGAEMTDFLTQAFNELETESSTAVTESNFDYLMSDALIESPTLENQHKAPSVETLQSLIQSIPTPGSLLPPTPPTWTGPLFINDSERLCQITLSASASDFETEPSGFMAELQYMNSLYLALYELPLIRDSVVQAMVPPAELLTVDGEASCLEKLTIFMAKNDLVALAPTDVQGYGLIDADAEDIASSIVMLLPSTSLQKLFPALNLSDRRLETDLTAVYLEWSIQTDPPLRHSQLNHSLGRIITSLRSPSTQYLPLTEATLSLSILQVSPLIHRFFSLSSHIPYFIWESIDPRTDFTLRVETSLLVDVLRRSHINSTQTPPEQGPVLVFIHASHISTISRLPGLVERRKQLETTFFIYGPPSISETSSLRYIFPAGGVLTFTASCLLAKPYELLKKVKEVAAHPLWCTYIIPPVLGLAMKLFYGEKNPLDEYDKGNFIFDPFLEAIEQDLALVHTPPQADAGNWISEQLESLLRDRRDTLEYCLSEVEADPRYSMISGASHRVLEDDMFDDISRLHIQPRIMSDYRRFVVLVDAKDLKHLDRFKHAGFECIPVQHLSELSLGYP